MENENKSLQTLFSDNGIQFQFSNLKNLSESQITYSQFLSLVAQRLLLKQYSAQAVDEDNLLCYTSNASDTFNNNKKFFGNSLKNLVLKRKHVSMINAQTSKNKITQELQEGAAAQFIKWYESNWFNRLKSEDFSVSLEKLFDGSEPPIVESTNSDWKTLFELYKNVDENEFFERLEIEDRLFINGPDSVSPDWFYDVMEDCYKFMKLTGNIDMGSFEGLIINQQMITPTVSAFMISTMMGIDEIENGTKKFKSPYETYSLFRIFRGTSMGYLLRMNQFVFTLYNYFKMLEK